MRMFMNRFFRSEWLYIAVLCIFIGIIFFIRCYNRESSGDELYYEYVWESDDNTSLRSPDHRYERRISSWDEIVQTQIIHYLNVNGRALIHTTEQAFTDHMLTFSILNTTVFLIFVSLIIYYVVPEGRRDNYFLWLSVFMVVILLFPHAHSLWPSINFGLNYLWPSTMSVAVFILWDKIRKGQLDSKYNIPMIIFAMIFGWTHELFVISIGGAMFFYYCFHFKQFRGQVLALALPMWATAILLVFSPGNMIRYFGAGETAGEAFYLRILNGIDLLTYTKIFPCMLVLIAIVLLSGGRHRLKVFISENILLAGSFILSLVFTIIANSYEQSVTLIELTSMLLIFKYICPMNWYKSNVCLVLSIVLSVCFAAQQVIVAKDTVVNSRYQHELVKEFIESPDGLIHYSDSFINPLSRPYVKTWGDERFYPWSISHILTGSKKPFTLLMDADYMAVSQPDSFFVEKNRMPGTAPVYYGDGGDYYWVKPDELKPGEKLVADLWPVDFNHKGIGLLYRLRFALFPEQYESKMKLDIDTVESPRYGRLLMVKVPAVRKVQAINIKQ